MYWLRLLENLIIGSSDNDDLSLCVWHKEFYDERIRYNVGPGFLNAWFRYQDPF